MWTCRLGTGAAHRHCGGHRRHQDRRRLEPAEACESIEKDGQLQQRRDERTRQELRQIVAQRLEARARGLCQGTTYDELERTVLERGMDPWAATDVLLDGVGA
jgi:hypothetical protein